MNEKLRPFLQALLDGKEIEYFCADTWYTSDSPILTIHSYLNAPDYMRIKETPKPDECSGLEGTNINRLRKCLTHYGCHTVGEEETAANLTYYINNLTLAIIKNM